VWNTLRSELGGDSFAWKVDDSETILELAPSVLKHNVIARFSQTEGYKGLMNLRAWILYHLEVDKSAGGDSITEC
jgi:hypothetical protein